MTNLGDWLYQAPALRLEIGQQAKVRVKGTVFKEFKNPFKEGRKEWRIPVEILEGVDVGHIRTFRTGSEGAIYDLTSLAITSDATDSEAIDLTDFECWIVKGERRNAKGASYSVFVFGLHNPLTGIKDSPRVA